VEILKEQLWYTYQYEIEIWNRPDMKFDPTYTLICPPYSYSQIFLAFSCIQVTIESQSVKLLRETKLIWKIR